MGFAQDLNQKNPTFCPFSHFWGHKKLFSKKKKKKKNNKKKKKKKKSALSRNTSCGFLTLCQNLKKTNDQVPRKPRADISLDLSGYSWGYSLESHIFQPFV